VVRTSRLLRGPVAGLLGGGDDVFEGADGKSTATGDD
jgi:hypothetical protein